MLIALDLGHLPHLWMGVLKVQLDHMGIVWRKDKPFQTKMGLLQRVDARKAINKYPIHPK